MSQAFHFGSVSGGAVASVLFFGMAAFIGVAAAAILRRLAAPAGEPSYYGTTPGARRVVGTIVALGVAVPIWIWLWSGFYRADVTTDAITFRYSMPTRSTTIARRDVAAAGWEPAARGSRVFVVVTHDGRRFASAQARYSRETEREIVAAFDRAGAR
jgi:hypothetical protein